MNEWNDPTDESYPALTGKLLIMVVCGVRTLGKRVYNPNTDQCYFEDYTSGTRIKDQAVQLWCYAPEVPKELRIDSTQQVDSLTKRTPAEQAKAKDWVGSLINGSYYKENYDLFRNHPVA
jgi:hypothetical protein